MELPYSWSQITLKQLADIDSARAYDGNEIHRWNRIVSALTGETLETIEAMPFDTVSGFMSKCNWIIDVPTKIMPDFILKGIKYNLCTNPYNMTTGQYATLTEYIKKDGYYKLAECAAVMCIPEGEVYNSKALNERAQLFWDELTVDIVYPYASFFLTLLEKSLPVIQESLKQKVTQVMKETKDVLMEMEGHS